MTDKVRVRFAPSPTGYLHVGGARTALYNYLFAKHFGGKFILRIEDTDQARSTEESLKMLIEDLLWLGLKWDEGVDPKTLKDVGEFGPYKQSERLAIYKTVADEIIKAGLAYYCFMTDAEIDKQKELFKAQGKPPHIQSPYASMPLAEALIKIKGGEKAVVRFRTSSLKKDYVFKDLIRGEVKFPSDMVGDFVLLRSDGMPVYNFCCVVDDYKMGMTHILRAEEHLSNTLRQLMIYEAMKWKPPEFGHLSLVLDEDRQKLSKRKGATSCHEFKLEGYLPEALKNFIALLGWSHPEGKEVMSMEEMIKNFSTSRVNPAGAVFDSVKLKWMNAQHLRALPHKDLWNELLPFIKTPLSGDQKTFSEGGWADKALTALKPSFETLVEGAEAFKVFSEEMKFADEAEEVFKWPTTKSVFEAWYNALSLPKWGTYLLEEEFLEIQKKIQTESKVKGKELFQALRVAVIGKPHGTELKLLVPLMKLENLKHRAKLACERV
ncbi:MAG: glutamate--tRNA ligase [Oligoflexia bacterium]|nr:glutamate--tRNA ligase [Oligoflexia bacterium]